MKPSPDIAPGGVRSGVGTANGGEWTRVTHSTGNDQLLYFTSPSLLADDRGLVFISDRTGSPNLFFLDFATGKERQLTDQDQGYLKSYVYFDGQPYRGFGKASVSLDPVRGRVFHIQGREIRVVDLDGRARVLAELPPGQMTAFTHVSSDGSRLCVPTTDGRALDDEKVLPAEGPDYNIDRRVQDEGLQSYLRIYDTESGREVQVVPVPRAWVTHVQFSPTSRDWILYNHEWPAFDCGVRRMWLWNGGEHVRLRQEGTAESSFPRSRHDWTSHEMWERDGSALIYHGSYQDGPAFLGRMTVDGSEMREIALPADWKQYGHFTVGRSNHLVSDGYYQTPETAAAAHGSWISRLDVDWKGGRVDWKPLGLHGSTWSSQDAHPHPIFSPRGDAVYFTSDREGKRAIYRRDL